MIPTTGSDDPPSTRERIRLEASRLLARKGHHGTSAQEIAAAVEIQQPSLFHHFASKRSIMAELIDVDHDEATLVAQRTARDSGNPALRLFRYLVADTSYICSCAYDLSSASDG